MILPSQPLLVVLCLCSSSIVLQQLQPCSALSPDGLTLLAFKSAVSADPSSSLAGWDETATDPCLWPGVSCANISGFSYPRVVALSIPGKLLSGYIPSELGSLVFLRRLNLHSNLLSGPIPPQLSSATSLHSLYLYSNNLSGPFPSSLCSLPRLQNLDISGNALSGAIPAGLGGCHQLQRLVISGNRFSGMVPARIWPGLGSLMHLDLSSNGFTGPIPPDLGDLKSLSGTLNLSHNQLSGEIPRDLGHLPATVRLDLRDNNLSGQIPQVGALSNQGATAFLGNAKLCGFPLPNSCQELSPARPGVQVSVPRSGGPGGGKARKKGLRLEVIILIALANAAGVAVIGLVVVYAYWKLKDGGNQGCSCTGKTKLGGGGRGAGKGGGHWPCSCCWKEPRVSSPSSPSEEEEEEGEDSDGGPGDVTVEGRLVAMDKGFAFELDELLRASAYVLGKSRLGIVYKVVLGSGVPVAVRRLGEGGAQRRREFAAEAQAIGRVRHPNVVRLRAFYWSPEEKLLVSDFIANGSLAAALRGGRSGQPGGLTWAVRLRIARGTARGLAHIHECSARKFVHGDIRPSNILLEPDFTPRISDFGLVRLLQVAGPAPSDAFFPYHNPSSSVDGPNCYRAPEARVPGGRPAQQRSDVYSFGLVLLELLTGKSPEFTPPCAAATSSSRASAPGEAELVRWVRTGLEDERPLAELVDPALLWQARATGEVVAAFRVALACAETDPEQRPRMRTVSDSLEKIGT